MTTPSISVEPFSSATVSRKVVPASSGVRWMISVSDALDTGPMGACILKKHAGESWMGT